MQLRNLYLHSYLNANGSKGAGCLFPRKSKIQIPSEIGYISPAPQLMHLLNSLVCAHTVVIHGPVASAPAPRPVLYYT